MKDEIRKFLEVRESSKAKRPKIKYRRGSFTAVIPEDLQVDTEKMIEENSEWFREHLEEARRYREKVPERDLRPGGKISLLGDKKKITVEKRRSNEIDNDVVLAEHLVKRTSFIDQLEKSLRSFAREKFEEKASAYSKKISGSYDKIFIRDQKTRWGSCSSQGNLNFNWRLVLGPGHVFDYVVVHEIVHLEESNHGKSFWKKVEEIYPNYDKSSQWLENESAKLVFDKSDF